MDRSAWSAVDAYIVRKLLPADPSLAAVLEANRSAGLPSQDVSPVQGKFLHLIARMVGARRVLEMGTLGGYSTIWLARALPEGGCVVSLEANEHHARIAQANVQHAGLCDRVKVIVGRALDTLPALEGPFDLIFIDADKPGYPAYLDWALKLSRGGTVIVADNVVRQGAVVDEASPDPNVQGVRRFFDALAAEPRIDATALQTVGVKSWDGFAIGIVA
jgi:predicted O-methyltransferase YrrM